MSPSIDCLSVRLKVDMSCYITVGLYAGPITPEVVAEHVHELVVNTKAVDLIDKVSVDAIEIDTNGVTLFEAGT